MSLVTQRLSGKIGGNANVRFVRLPNRRSAGGVYFIECHGFEKIGVSGDIAQRFEEFQRVNPLEMRVLGVIAAPDAAAVRIEGEVHERFSAAHHRGEWFHLTDEIRAFVKTLDKWLDGDAIEATKS